MPKISLLIAIMVFFVFSAQADEVIESRIQTDLLNLSDRLELSSDQEMQVRLIIEDHLKTQIAILQKHELDIGNRNNGDAVDLQQMRTLRKELGASDAEVESQLSEVLSTSQLAEYRRIRMELDQKIRERFLSSVVNEIGVKLELTTEQTNQAEPILKAHFELQTDVLDKHGITLGKHDGEKRPGFRTLRRVRKDLKQINVSTAKQLSTFFSKAQLEEFETLQKEQRKKLRKQLRQQ